MTLSSTGYILKELPSSLFKNLTKLKTVNLPSSLTKIGSDCFSGCSALTTITIPINVVEIGRNCFGNSGLTSATFTDFNAEWYYNSASTFKVDDSAINAARLLGTGDYSASAYNDMKKKQ